MTADREPFAAIEIDSIDEALSETAKRKRIPSLTLNVDGDGDVKGETLGGGATKPARLSQAQSADSLTDGHVGPLPVATAGPEPTHRPKTKTARKRPLSLEVPDYLARELKVKAATEAVTVRYLVLSALDAAGYRVDADELEEDGRRLR